MILFFHFLCLLARYIVTSITKSISKRKLNIEEKNKDDFFTSTSSELLHSHRDFTKPPVYEDGVLKFFPPVYVQRYETVALILKESARKERIQKVVDFGCAELGFFMYLKNIEEVKEIIEVDIDTETLERYSYKAAPLTTDYLMSKANKPLDVYIYEGSIADYDDCLIDTDVVIGIELIEHLSEEALEKLPYNVFCQIKPTLAIFTTPNADFNSLFPNFTDVRHSDHKFEWTRKEFYNWTQEVIKNYPEYSVRFYGVGAGPEGSENLGCCSQMAVFQRSDESKPFSTAREESTGVHNYKLIKHYKYPVSEDKRTREEKILHEIQYQMAHFGTLPKYYNYEENESEIPVTLLKEYVADLCTEDTEFREILKKSGMKIRKKNNTWFLVYTDPETCSLKSSLGDDDVYMDEVLTGKLENNEIHVYEKDWDEEEFPFEEMSNFQSARSAEELKNDQKAAEKSSGDFFPNLNPEYFLASQGEIQSSPEINNELPEDLAVPKGDSNNCKSKNGSTRQTISGKSKIPLKKKAKDYLEENFSGGPTRKSNLFCVRNFSRKIAKSFSLDSGLENVDDEAAAMPEGVVPFLGVRSLSSFDKSKLSSIGSRSSLLSGSFEKAADSGYPYTVSLGIDSTPGQVDELSSGNEGSDWSASESSEDEEYVLHPDNVRQVFAERAPVENGDLANNNRDGEGNNVEGMMGERLANRVAEERDPNDNMFFPEFEDFPPWLLHLGNLRLDPVAVPLNDPNEEVGFGDASDSDFDLSVDQEDLEFEFDYTDPFQIP